MDGRLRGMIITLLWVLCVLATKPVAAQERRPTISFITQPEIVTDIGGTAEMKCSIQYSRVRLDE
jgi:hypothetical protein